MAAIAANAWALHTPGSSYVVVLDKHGNLVQRYWGEQLPEEALPPLADDERVRWNSSFQRPSEIEEQLPVDGGHRWAVPSLQLRFPGEVRALDLSFVEARTGSDTLVLVFCDTGYELDVELVYRVRDDTDVLERRVMVRNRSSDAVEILRLDSGNWLIPDHDDYRLSTATGHWGAETQLERRILPIGEHALTSRQGVSGHGANPWMMIDDGRTLEDSGRVYSLALGWSGSWRMIAQRRPEGQVSVTGGWGHEGLSWRLEPGTALETPAFFGLVTDGGFGAASRAWHHFARRHVQSHPDENRPVLYNSWEATGFDIDEATQLTLAEQAAELGVELYVMDDGWFGERVDDRAGLGDWTPRPDRFPNGLGTLARHVHSLGMGFGMWVEPEMVNADSELYRTHPDWVLHWPSRPRSERRFQLVLNFARPEVRAWALDWLDELVTDAELDFLKWDMNRPFTEAGWPGVAGQDRLWIEHVEGVYAILDELRRRHPGLRIESCASGGARADLGILTRTDQVWTSDNTDALDRQRIQHGFSQLYPAGVMGAWVTDEVNPMTRRRIPLSYRFDVAMAGVLGLGADLRDWDSEERAYARERIAEYKRIRPTVQHGQQYRLGGEPGREFSAVQYLDADRVVLFQYEPHRTLSTGPRRIRLVGLDPTAWYLDAATGERHHGALLLARGLRVLPESTDRGWDNVRFSSYDYASSVTVLEREQTGETTGAP
ncbi:MAG: alpha-galactosidase [Leifsonia xyli]|nr:MAG: alpha-galactosidase [Leifsonia xyli]